MRSSMATSEPRNALAGRVSPTQIFSRRVLVGHNSTVFDVCNNTSVPMLQESADVITDWSRRNDMRINARKTKEMITV